MELKNTDFNIKSDSVSLKKSKGPALLLIYANWCGHCTAFKPTYGKLQTFLGDSFKCYAIEDSEINKSQDLYIGLKFQGYPTLKFIDENGKIGDTYTGSRDINSILTFICTRFKYCVKQK